MTPEPTHSWGLLAVKKQREVQPTEVMKILQGLGIEAELMGTGTPAEEPGSTVFQIPLNRLQEAIVALGHHGFSDVRAYAKSPVAGAVNDIE